MLLFRDDYQPWVTIEHLNSRVLYKGSHAIAEDLLSAISSRSKSAYILKNALAYLDQAIEFSSGAIETESHIFAWTDHIRSWPVFYALTSNDLVVSGSAQQVIDHAGLNTVDQDSMIEFAMSGFIGGNKTLYEGLFCLKPGEVLLYDKIKKDIETSRFFSYVTDTANKDSQTQKISELGIIIDTVFKEIIERADGRTIWVPLSAGLDSRIILCKLLELGCNNIKTFTYGPKYNFEAKYARKIAKKLDIPWQLISLSSRKIKNLYNANQRRNYWDYAGNYKVIPAMGGLAAMLYLSEQGSFKKGDIFINGQSGDYITGGHIFIPWFDEENGIGKDRFLQSITAKHHALWSSLNTDETHSVLENRIGSLITDDWANDNSFEARAGQLELWEYDARQICYVVNGQRIYDFLGYKWELPLWDKRLVDFCQHLPLSDKKGQALYKAYLRKYNYKGLFPENEPKIWRWPLNMLWIVPVARLFSFLGQKSNFYALMRYFGHYNDQFSVFPFQEHVKTFKKSRNVSSLSVRAWLLDHRNIVPKFILEAIE